jgi:hypothetical protein
MAERKARAVLTLLAALVAAAALAVPAQASQQIESFEILPSETGAGAHPDINTSFSLADPGGSEAARDVIVRTPEGLFGNPNAVTKCTSSDFALQQCPAGAQVGLVSVRASYNGEPDHLFGTAPLFAVEPTGENTAAFAFIVPSLNIPINIPIAVRTGSDYGLDFTVHNITQLFPLASADLTFWGFPAFSAHDAQRFPKGAPGEPSNCPGIEGTACIEKPVAAGIPVRPLTDNPTTCPGHSLTAVLEVETYQDPGNRSKASAEYPATTDCDLEVFKPVLYASPTTNETDAASGLNIELSAPQFLGFAASPSEVRKATVTLPEGFTINPDAADGQTMCTTAQANFGSPGPAHCPDTSKIGTFSIGTQALDGRLEGAVYIGEPQPGNQYRLFEVASGFGMNVKLVGSIKPDPVTGQVTAYFEDLPQAPFDDFQLHLFSSDRGLMATPTRCTIYETHAVFYPWNATLAEQDSTQTFGLDSGPGGAACPGQFRPFDPQLVAGTSNPQAGDFNAFSLRLDRKDGDQFLGKLAFEMPPGLTGSLRGISYCSEAAIQAAAQAAGRHERAQPSCPSSSAIGTSNVAAGPGSHPFHAFGKIYLAGPVAGAPLSLVAITPALAGPYDYGNVVVRVPLKIDPLDAHVLADSEPVPQIIGGIPIRMRSIEVSIDKPNFMINPTNCSPFSVLSRGVGDQGTAASFASPFQVVNCSSLPFKPRMTIKQLGSRKQTRRSKDPVLQFDLRTRPGDANVKSVAVTLPTSFAIDQRHLANICSRAQLERERCAGRQPLGTVLTETPLLDQPLTGLAYAVSGYGKLPHLAFILGGQVTLVPQAESSSVERGHLRTTVPVVPDAPIGRFSLKLYGGKKGYIINSRSLCSGPQVIKVDYVAQNGKTLTQRVETKTACGKGKRGAGRRSRERH